MQSVSLEIAWPSGKRESFGGIKANQSITHRGREGHCRRAADRVLWPECGNPTGALIWQTSAQLAGWEKAATLQQRFNSSRLESSFAAPFSRSSASTGYQFCAFGLLRPATLIGSIVRRMSSMSCVASAPVVGAPRARESPASLGRTSADHGAGTTGASCGLCSRRADSA